jgi:threonine/homoserine/homoserine lactone efflux protein
MIEFLPSSSKLAAFLAASLVLAIVPGPGVVYLTTQTLAHGRRAGIASVGGVALGNLGSAVAASLGLAALLNPKTALFYGAFLPQFVDPAAGSPLGETLLLAALFVIIAVVTDSVYVCMASALSTAAGSRARWGSIWRYATAATLVGLGVYAVLSSSKSSK